MANLSAVAGFGSRRRRRKGLSPLGTLHCLTLDYITAQERGEGLSFVMDRSFRGETETSAS
jgi:hypothetical protein